MRFPFAVMPNGNFINTDIFDLLEFDMLELSFEITLFNSFITRQSRLKCLLIAEIVISGLSSMIVRSNAVVILALG